MGKLFAIFCGLLFMAGSVWLAIFVWWKEFRELILGSIPPLLFLVGLIVFIAGISSIKDAQRIKKLQEETATEEPESEATEEAEQETKEA
jgi:Na+/H+-dicarboxylate symporter